MSNDHNPTSRFANRVADYVLYRPGYPPGALAYMREKLGLRPEHVVADIGSGTGIFTRELLANGNVVFGVEPNQEMRRAGEQMLAGQRSFRSVAGTSEATGLPDASVNFITAAQAFHWFEPVATQTECERILRPNGVVVLLWNDRSIDATPFLVAYEDLLKRHGTDYEAVVHRNVVMGDQSRLEQFFGDSGVVKVNVGRHEQAFDFEGLRGRLFSSSYVPAADDPRAAPMVEELERLFMTFAVEGRVAFVYDTLLYHACRP